MNLEALRTEFLARGFDYLSGTRADNYLNDAYLLDICEEEDWPFLETTAEGSSPLTVSDLRTLRYVIDRTNECKLEPLQLSRLTDIDPLPAKETGTPEIYYLTEGKVINVFPVQSVELAARYWKAPVRLTGTATPVLPERFHSLIVDGAVARAYEDSDDYELAQAASTRFQERLERMRASLGMPQHDAPDDFVVIEDPAALH